MLYYAMHRDMENIRLLPTVTRSDTGTTVAISEIATEADISPEPQAALQALAGGRSRRCSPGIRRHCTTWLAALAGLVSPAHGTRHHC